MDLSSLTFHVETKPLQDAITLVSKLGDAVQELGKDVQVLAAADKNASAATLMQAKARKENAAAAKLESAAIQSTEKAKKASTTATDASTKAVKANVDMLQRQKDIFDFMGQGFSKGQSSILATAKATGQLSTALEEVLQAQRRLQGGDPFDKSLGAVTRVKNEYAELRDQVRMTGAGVELMGKQYRELTRSKLGLIEVMKSQGRSFSEIRNAVRNLNADYISLATVNNRLIAEEKEQERQTKKTANAAINAAKATSFLEQEMERAQRALEGLNSDLHLSTTNRLLKFEQQLKASGMSAAEAETRLLKYKNTLTQIDKVRTQKGHLAGKTEEDRKVDYLARGLAPQISDVLVSLQGGMNPFTVLMQQGMQVRDLMQLSGVEAGRMGDAFRKAGQGMVTTTIAASKAIGSMLLGVLMDTGKAATDFIMKMSAAGPVIEKLRYEMTLMQGSGSGFQKWVATFGLGLSKLIPALAGVAAGIAALGLGAFAVGLYKVTKQENEFNRVLTMSGASLGLTQSSAYTLAKTYGELNGSQSKTIEVMQEMAKAGGLTRDMFPEIADAAIAMSKATGASIEETVKKFSDLAKEPSKVLLEISTQTGYITLETMKLVRSLEESGDKAGASAVAVRAYAEASKEAAATVQRNYGTLTRFAIGAKGIFSSMWDAILGVGRAGSLPEQIAKAQAEIARFTPLAARGDGFSKEKLAEAQATLANLTKQNAEEKKLGEQRKVNSTLNQVDATLAEYRTRNMSEYQKKTNELIQTEQKLLALQAQGQDVSKQLNEIRSVRNNLEKEYIKGLEKANKTPKPKKDPEEGFINKALKDFEVNAAQAELATLDLISSQKVLLNIVNDAKWDKLNEGEKLKILNTFKLAYANEVAAEAIKKASEASKQAAKESFTNDSQAFDAVVKYEEGLRDASLALKEETADIAFQSNLLGMANEDRAKAIELRKAEIEYQKKLNEINQLNPEFANRGELKAQALAIRNQKILNANKKAANEANQIWVDGITDAVVTGLFEGGQAGKKKLRDLIVAELQKPITLYINATINDIVGLITGTGANSSGGLIQQGMQLYNAYTMASGGVSGAGAAAVGGSINAIGAYAGGSMSAANTAGSIYANTTGTGINGLLSTNGAYGTAGASGGGASSFTGAGYTAAGVAGGIYGGRAISSGYSAWGGASGNSAVNTGTAVGAVVGSIVPVIGTAVGALVGGLIGGIVNVAFGRKLKEEGIKAAISGGQVTDVQNYKFEKGGWFRSNKTTTSEADAGTINQVTEDFNKLKSEALGLTYALGGNADAVNGWSGELKVNMKGVKTAAEASQRYEEALADTKLQMIEASGALDNFKRAGETTEMALQRMTEEANNLASAAGYSAENMSQIIRDGMLGRMSEADVGAALAEQILGSIYNAMAQGFADQITNSITTLIIQPIMTSILAGGVTTAVVSKASMEAVYNQAKATIDAFSAVLNDPAIQELFAELGDLSSKLAGVIVKPVASIRTFTGSMRSAGSAASDAAKKIADEKFGLQGDLMRLLGLTAQLRERELAALHASNRPLKQYIYALEDAAANYDSVRSSAEEALSAAQDAEGALKDIFDTLMDSIRELRGEVDSTSAMQQAEATAYIRSLIAGAEIDSDKLGNAIDSIKSGIDSNTFVSQVDENRARLQFATMLSQLQGRVGSDLAGKSADVVLLEEQLNLAEQQVNALLGIQTNTYTTSEAIAALQAAVSNYSNAIATGLQAVSGASTSAPASVASGGYSGGGSSGGSSSAGSSGVWTADGYWAKNTDLHKAFEEQNLANSPQFNQDPKLSARDEYLKWHWEKFGKKEKRRFASGAAFTNSIVRHPTDFNMGQMAEAGPEAVMPLTNINGSLGVRAIDSGDTRLSDQIELLQLALEQVVISTNKLQRQFNNARSEDGTSLNVTVVNTTAVPVDQVP